MKVLIELNNIDVETVNSKCTYLSKTEGDGDVKVKMYGKCMAKFFTCIFQYDAIMCCEFDVHQNCRARENLFYH